MTESGRLQLLAVVISAAIHDYYHPGHTNSYATAMGFEASLMYNDKSVYENLSIFLALQLANSPECAPASTAREK